MSNLNERFFEIRKKAKENSNVKFKSNRRIIFIIVILIMLLIKLYSFFNEREEHKLKNEITPFELLNSPDLSRVKVDSLIKFGDFQFFVPSHYNYLSKNNLISVYNDSLTISYVIGKNNHGLKILDKYYNELKQLDEIIVFTKSSEDENIYNFKIEKNNNINSIGKLKLINSKNNKHDFFLFLIYDPKIKNTYEVDKIINHFQ